MCANYTPGRNERNQEHFGVSFEALDERPETFPGYLAPIIRLAHESPHLEAVAACYGMVPHWADLKLARQTYNARSETVATKPSYRNAWKKKQFCIIPAANIFEPCYETGKAIRWRIWHAKERPVGLAGIWEWRPDGSDGKPLISFSMLTINADGHPLMQRFHKPDEEKRMVVILEPHQYRDWLAGQLVTTVDDFQRYPAEQLVAIADPLPARSKVKLLKQAA